MFATLFSAATRLIGGRKQSRDNARASLQERQNALADYDKQRAHALQDYDTQRGHSLQDYHMQRGHALQDYDTQRGHSLQDYHMQRGHALQDYQTQRADSAYDQATYWQKHRAASEAAGFNPLVTMGMTPQVGGQSIAQSAVAQHSIGQNSVAQNSIGQNVTAQTTINPSVMGQSFADAGLLIADGISRAKEQNLQAEQLRIHNERLNEKLRQATFQPRVRGIYDHNQNSDVLPSDHSDLLNDPRNVNIGFRVGSSYVLGDGKTSNSEWMETQYGDAVSWFYGAGLLGRDLINKTQQKALIRKRDLHRHLSSMPSQTELGFAERQLYRQRNTPSDKTVGRLIPNNPNHRFRGNDGVDYYRKQSAMSGW